MRVSSPTAPFLIGTLKSTRTSTRRPAGSRSRTDCLWSGVTFRSGQLQQRIHDPLRKPPLVVVPGEHLDQGAVEHGGREGVEHAAVRVANDVAGNDRILAVLEDAFHR